MPDYTIEARSLRAAGIAGHDFWVLRDEQGKALAELHGLATDRVTKKAITIGTNEEKHSLRAWHYPHDPAYAGSLGVRPDSTTYINPDQPSRTVATGSKEEMLDRWNTAVRAVPELNELDLNYPAYGFKTFGETVNSNSTYRTFGELMDVPVNDFPGRIEPGIDNRMLSEERTQQLRYQGSPDKEHGNAHPTQDPRNPQHPDHALQQQISDRLQALGGQYAENAEKYSLSLLHDAKQGGLTSVSQIVTSNATATRAEGETLFMVQGRSGDPAAQRVAVSTAAMAEMTEDASLQRLQQQAQNQPVQEPSAPAQQQGIPAIGGR